MPLARLAQWFAVFGLIGVAATAPASLNAAENDWAEGRTGDSTLLRAVKGGAACRFRSREWEPVDQRPQLEIVRAQDRVVLPAAADTSLNASP
jgi:hypothetical protein